MLLICTLTHTRNALFYSSSGWIQASHSLKCSDVVQFSPPNTSRLQNPKHQFSFCISSILHTSSNNTKDQFYNIIYSLGHQSHHFKEKMTLKFEMFVSGRKRKKYNYNKERCVWKVHTYGGGSQPFIGLFGAFSASLSDIWYVTADSTLQVPTENQTHKHTLLEGSCKTAYNLPWDEDGEDDCVTHRMQRALWLLSTVTAEICRARKLLCHTISGMLERYE